MADFGKTEFEEDGDDFTGFEDGNISHDSTDSDVLNSYKFGLQHGFAIFQEHCDDIV